MESPISSVLAELVMEDMEYTNRNKSFRILFNYCFVDNMLIYVDKDDLFVVLDHFNQKGCLLQITLEQSLNQRIISLDTNLIFNEGYIKTVWYQKPIASGRTLNFPPNH